LEVYKRAFEAAMRIFDLTKSFPKEETYSLTDQVRRSSRSICASISEGWRKRCYKLLFINKLADADGEAAETQTWIQFAVKCGYLKREIAAELYREYDDIIGMLVKMYTQPDQWIL
jgi:four helix bundle protein